MDFALRDRPLLLGTGTVGGDKEFVVVGCLDAEDFVEVDFGV